MMRGSLAMRWWSLMVVCLLALGCGQLPADSAPKTARAPRREGTAPATAPAETPKAAETPRATVKGASDWSGFLGPFGNGTSPETGILAPWPEKGLRMVWKKQ